jgi:hypothetical protein
MKIQKLNRIINKYVDYLSVLFLCYRVNINVNCYSDNEHAWSLIVSGDLLPNPWICIYLILMLCRSGRQSQPSTCSRTNSTIIMTKLQKKNRHSLIRRHHCSGGKAMCTVSRVSNFYQALSHKPITELGVF